MVASKATSLFSQSLYHTGRLISYVALGSVMGAIGAFFRFEGSENLQHMAAIVTALLLFGIALSIWRGQTLHLSIPFLNRFFASIQSRLLKSSNVFIPFFVGLFTIGLPCGWLYVFLLGAASTGTALYGGLYMLFFWLGTVPALGLFGLFGNSIISPLTKKFPKASAILLLCIGCYSLFTRF
jgi:sulfite exporter TauE/SafE